MTADAVWLPQARAVAELCLATELDVRGAYVHGSAALGGFTPASDLDLLVVADGDTEWARLGAKLLETAAPFPLEVSVVSFEAAGRARAPWDFRLHVATPETVMIDAGEGDPDLIAHYAVTRRRGVTIVGPPPGEVFGIVDRVDLLSYLAGELEWGLAHGDETYAVLNACRAAAYAEEGVLLSKVAGGRRWLERHGATRIVESALHAQGQGIAVGPSSPEARAFVEGCRRIVMDR